MLVYIIRQSVKMGFQALQKPGHSTGADPLNAVRNRAMQRIILAAGLVVFLIALVRVLF